MVDISGYMWGYMCGYMCGYMWIYVDICGYVGIYVSVRKELQVLEIPLLRSYQKSKVERHDDDKHHHPS